MKFNLYKSMEFPSDINASCMRINNLIPLRDDFLYDFGTRSPLEACLTKSLTTIAIDCEHLSATPELIETILALEVTEEEYVFRKSEKDSG